MRWRSLKARIRAGGQAEPPITTRVSEEVSYDPRSSSSSKPVQMVGTARLKVGRSAAIMRAIGSG